jgi:predicted SAM-dependent methyltransferase
LKELLHEISAHYRDGRRLQNIAQGKRGLLLNVGCGPLIKEGWLNLDVYPVTQDAVYFDALNPLPIDNGAVRRIHCEHFLEHLEYDHAVCFLSECYRVLEPLGTLRIIVPDAEKYMVAYADANSEYFRQLKFLGNAARELETSCIICNQMFRMGGDHKFAWDFATLELACRRIGFASVKRSVWREGEVEFQIDGEEDWRSLESLYCVISK